MAITKSKTELVRLAWIAALRQQGDRQCSEAFAETHGARVCALGLLIEVAGHDPSHPENLPFKWADDRDIGTLAGLTKAQSREIARRNDGGGKYHQHTFAEIADVVAGWFKE